MSVSEIAVSINKTPGSAIGFTLIKDSCTISKIIDLNVARELIPGDVILSINGFEVTGASIRDRLRDCRTCDRLVVTVARTNIHQQENYDMSSPVKNTSRGCFCMFSKKNSLNVPSRTLAHRNSFANRTESSLHVPRKRTSSIGDTSSPRNFGSVSSLSSAGMRPVDLRKLTKEGAGTMWMVGRGNSTTK
jgi:hypothetical protein